MKSRHRSQTSNLANAGKRRRTWPKFEQRPFPPHSQPNGTYGDPLMGQNLAAMLSAQMQPEDKQELAALPMQEAETMETEELAAKSEEETLQKQEAEDEVMKTEGEEMQKKEAEDEATQNVQLQADRNADETSSQDFLR